MDIINYINKEFWCSFKNNNRTLFERSLWIKGANKYKNKVIKNLITEDITIYYSNNTRQLRGFNGNQKPICDDSLKNLKTIDLMKFINEYYILKDKLYESGKEALMEIENNSFENFKRIFKNFVIIHARIFAYEYLISSLGQDLYNNLKDFEIDKFSIWKNKEQVNSHEYFVEMFKYIKDYFKINIDIRTLELYSHVDEIINLLNGKLSIKTLSKRIYERKNGFVLCNLHDKRYNNKIIGDLELVEKIKLRLENLEIANLIDKNKVRGQSTYEDKLIIAGECVVVNNYDNLNEDIFNKIVVCSVTTANDVYKYLDVKAFIVDHGGILSHAAIFSREYNKPCLMGTQVGTKVFKTGDIIEIDFSKSIAYKI